MAALNTTRWSRFALRGPMAFAAVAGLGALFGLAIAAPIFGPDLLFPRAPTTIAVMPIVDESNDQRRSRDGNRCDRTPHRWACQDREHPRGRAACRSRAALLPPKQASAPAGRRRI